MEDRALINEIKALKADKGIYIMAHLYQDAEISEVADFTGDTLEIVRQAREVENGTIVVCAVRFIAEMVKLAVPEKKVILAHPDATCPMASQILPMRLHKYREEHRDACIVAYHNTTAALKAESDVCVSTATAVEVCEKLGCDEILFIPDRNLGEKIRRRTGKNVDTWNCYCPIHNSVTTEDIVLAKQLWPDAKVAAHLGCRLEVADMADYSGSAQGIMDYCMEQDEVIIAADCTLADRLARLKPDGRYHKIIPDKLNCNHMKLTSLTVLLRVLTGTYGCEIEFEKEVFNRARVAVEAMLIDLK